MIKVRGAVTCIGQLNLLVALVDAEFIGPQGDSIIKKLAAFYPHLPSMLVSVTDRGFMSHAQFQMHTLLALLQLEHLDFFTVDLNNPPEKELPF